MKTSRLYIRVALCGVQPVPLSDIGGIGDEEEHSDHMHSHSCMYSTYNRLAADRQLCDKTACAKWVEHTV